MATSKEAILYEIKQTHVSDIRAGDTVLIDGHLKTISKINIKRDSFMGTTLFGDSYNCGRLLVQKAIIFKALCTSK